MADFWIKVEKSTPDKPEIFEMSEILGIDPDAVLGKLIRVWCWADSNSENGHIKSVTSVLIDRLTMSAGFADAMKTVGWLSKNNIPNFGRHLGESAKKRAKDAERKRKSRALSEECHTKTVTERGLDKSRVDKKEKDKAAPCPHVEIIELYHECLPQLPRVIVDRWKGSKRERDLTARWRESDKHQDLDFWRWYFSNVKSSAFHMGQNDRGWTANLEWLVNRTNFDKMIERIVNQK